MVNYNPKDWSLFIFKMNKADTVQKLLPMLIYIAIYSFIVVFLLHQFLPKNLILYCEKLTIMHTLLGFIISILLVFRTNTAYDRWWEGRKVWGSIINTSRNLLVKFVSQIHNPTTVKQLCEMVVEFAESLKIHLNKHKGTKYPIDLPLAVSHTMYSQVCALHQNATINDIQFLTLNNDIQLLMDYTGMCERIKNTPIPFMYSIFIKKFIFIYVMTLPFVLAFNLSYLTVPVSVLVFYVLASLEIIAEEIEDPFGADSNDLPLENYVRIIEKSKTELLAKL